MFATLAAKAPVVATVHAYLDRSVAMELAAPILRRVWRRVTVGVAVSRGRGVVPPPRRCRRRRSRSCRTAWTSPPSPAPSRWTDLPAGRRILWVNRLDAQKGFPVALAAFSKVLVEVPDAILIVVGEGKDRESLRLLTESGARARRHARRGAEQRGGPRLPRRVRGVRRVRRRAGELRDRPRRGDGGRRAGRRERHPGLPRGRARTASTGSSCRRGTRRRSRPAWSACCREPELAKRLGEAGRERARTFDWPIVVDRLEELYGRADRERWLR